MEGYDKDSMRSGWSMENEYVYGRRHFSCEKS